MRRFIVFALVLSATACSKGIDFSSPTGPTPANDPEPTAGIIAEMTATNTANSYNLVITSTDNDLMHAIILKDALTSAESYDGGFLCVFEKTVPGPRFCTAIPFTPSGPNKTDRFVFAGIPSKGSVDVAFMFQPYAPKGVALRDIPVLLNRNMFVARGNATGCRISFPPSTPDYRLKCDTVPHK